MPLVRPVLGAVVLSLLQACAGAGSPVPVVPASVAAVNPASPSPSPSRVRPPVPSTGAIGTAHPIAVQASAADGRWIVACQARSDTNGDGSLGVAIGPHGDFYGDRMVPYLIVGEGEGEAIESFIARDPTDRMMVTLERGALTLRDTLTGARRVLDSGGFKRDAAGAGGDMIAGFDRDRSLVYLRGADPTARTIVVHGLESGREATIDPGPGKLLGAWVQADGRHLVVAVDLPVAGKLLARRSYTTRHRGPCRGPMMSSFTSNSGGPPGEMRVIDLEGGDRWSLPRADGRLVGVLGEQAIVRRGDGSIWGEGLDGGTPPHKLVDASCRGAILAASAARGSLLIRCDSIERPLLQIHDAQGVRLLEHRTFAGHGDEWYGGDRPRPLVHLSASAVLTVDLEAERTRRIALPEAKDARKLHWDAHHLLQARDGVLHVIGLEDGEDRPLDARAAEYARRRVQGSVVAVDRVIVDLAAGELLGAVPALPEALTALGHALTPEPPEPARGQRYSEVSMGPLRWRSPAPCPGTCPEGPV